MGTTKKQREQAIAHLLEVIPSDVLIRTYRLAENGGQDELIKQHLILGQWVRNTLRTLDFGWDDITLDNQWADLLSAAAARYVRDR